MALNTSLWCGMEQEVTFSIGDKTLTGNFMIEEVRQDFEIYGPSFTTLTLKAYGGITMLELTEPTIKNKKVNDCSIQELLYAIRQKTK